MPVVPSKADLRGIAECEKGLRHHLGRCFDWGRGEYSAGKPLPLQGAEVRDHIKREFGEDPQQAIAIACRGVSGYGRVTSPLVNRLNCKLVGPRNCGIAGFDAAESSMNILMFSNVYLPHVGGVARSVATWAQALRGIGHQVLVVTPETIDQPSLELGVLRYPALKGVYRGEFSLPLPAILWLQQRIGEFRPDIIHSHHPFLLGHTAIRLAAAWKLPLVFTYHTQYHLYTHYVRIRSLGFQRLVEQAAIGYANCCDLVIAPSESIARQIQQRGVRRPIEAIPTGIDIAQFAGGDGAAFRRRLGLSPEAFVIGHIGRLAPEKNLQLLLDGIMQALDQLPHARAVIAGEGTYKEDLQRRIAASSMHDRISLLGNLPTGELHDAYASFDVFAFASRSETQGLVLAEAMAAGAPVVALDGPGVREVVKDGLNGRLLSDATASELAQAIIAFAEMPESCRLDYRQAARNTAETYSMSRCVSRLASAYERLAEQHGKKASHHLSLARLIKGELGIWRGLFQTATHRAHERDPL